MTRGCGWETLSRGEARRGAVKITSKLHGPLVHVVIVIRRRVPYARATIRGHTRRTQTPHIVGHIQLCLCVCVIVLMKPSRPTHTHTHTVIKKKSIFYDTH